MRIVLMGTGPFALPTNQRLLADGHEIPLVVTRPVPDPRPKKLPPRPVYQWAVDAGIEIFEPATINSPESIERVASYSPDLLFVCDYGQILSKDCLRTARLGGLNLHGSLLPRHRGAAPVQWALLRGDQEAGVTVIHMTPKLDAGPALAVERTAIVADETAEQLEPRLAELGVAATVRAVERLADWDGQSAIGELQDQRLVTKAPRFSKADGQLDFRLSAEYLVRLVRACQPWPSTYAELAWPNGKRVRVMVRAARSTPSSVAGLNDAECGTVAAVKASQIGENWSTPWSDLLAVATSDGVLLISRLQPAGKREMAAEEFLRGHPVTAGTRFVLPDALCLPLV